MNPAVTFLGHASVLVTLGDATVITDPILHSRVTFLGRVSSGLDLTFVPDVDVVVISHLHHDHADARSLRLLPRSATLIVPVGAGAWARKFDFADTIELPVGEQWRRNHHPGSLRITAVPAVHDGFRVPFGPRAHAIGFLFEAGTHPTATVYFAGDTDIFPEMTELTDELDVALLPVWGWGPNLGPGHMNPRRAAESLELLKPRFAVPVHWGTLFPFGLRTVAPGKSHLLHTPPREFAEHALRIRPETQILHTEPGQQVEFTP